MKGGQQPNEDILTELKELKKMNQGLMNLVCTKVTPTVSPAQYGNDILNKAKVYGMHKTFESEAGAEPALGPDTLTALADCKTEHGLVALLTRPLEEIFGDSVCLVNSEEYAWLQTSEEKKYNQKPDLFLCHEENYKVMPVPKTAIPEPDKSRKFGVLSDWSLRDCLAATFEAKLKINSNAVGEATNYGNHIVSGDNSPPLAKIVLFDKTKFMLMEVSPGNVAIIDCTWDTLGSKALLRDFPLYQNPWTALVKEACQKWKLEIARGVNGSVWLGSGGYGRVFQVNKAGSNQPMALKVVQKSNIAKLSVEKAILRLAGAKCGDFVMPIEPNKEDLGWALLMSHVGSPVEQYQYEDVIRLLAALHEKGFLHGDPRLSNVVSVSKKLYWIDFMAGTRTVTPEAKVEDMGKLVANILYPIGIQECKALDSYDGSKSALRALITYVSQYVQSTGKR
jgi:hypothetical protein